jgi:GNAT superfamily N-acetyltransferase
MSATNGVNMEKIRKYLPIILEAYKKEADAAVRNKLEDLKVKMFTDVSKFTEELDTWGERKSVHNLCRDRRLDSMSLLPDYINDVLNEGNITPLFLRKNMRYFTINSSKDPKARGFATGGILRPENNTQYPISIFYVHLICSDKGGTRLMKAMEAVAKRVGCDRIWLSGVSNATGFYKKMGYTFGPLTEEEKAYFLQEAKKDVEEKLPNFKSPAYFDGAVSFDPRKFSNLVEEYFMERVGIKLYPVLSEYGKQMGTPPKIPLIRPVPIKYIEYKVKQRKPGRISGVTKITHPYNKNQEIPQFPLNNTLHYIEQLPEKLYFMRYTIFGIGTYRKKRKTATGNHWTSVEPNTPGAVTMHWNDNSKRQGFASDGYIMTKSLGHHNS